MARRPKPSRSGSPGCEPTATPCSTAASTVRCIVSGSPPWKPQARFAVVIRGSSAASAPSFQLPNDSPISQLMSMLMRLPGAR